MLELATNSPGQNESTEVGNWSINGRLIQSLSTRQWLTLNHRRGNAVPRNCEFDKLAKQLAMLIRVSALTIALPNTVGHIDEVLINCSLRQDVWIIYINVRQANLANDCQSLTVTASWQAGRVLAN